MLARCEAPGEGAACSCLGTTVSDDVCHVNADDEKLAAGPHSTQTAATRAEKAASIASLWPMTRSVMGVH